MTDKNFTTPEENRDRALDKLREYPLGPVAYYPSPDDEIHLRDYVQIILRRKWIVITVLVTVLTTVTIGTFMTKPQYRATTTIKINKTNPNILSFKDVYSIELPEEGYDETQFKVLKSRNLAKRVIRQMKLDATPEFSRQPAGLKQAAASFLKKPETLNGEDGIDPSLVNGFISRVEVMPQKNSRLVNVSFTSYDPDMAARVTNAIAKSFVDLDIESKFEATQQAREWLEKQLDAMKAKVEQAEEKLNQYAGRNEIIFLETKVDDDGKGGSSENLVSKKLASLSSELIAATSERIQKEALYNELKGGDAESSSLVMNSPLMQSLRKEQATLESEYNQNLKIYKPDYPKMVKLKELIDQISKRMATEAKKIVNSTRKDFEAAVKKESYLKAAFEKQKQEALDLNNRAVQYQILKREADTNKELYNGLLQRLKETGISASLTASNIQILDRAEVPKAPFKPNSRRNILLALIVGLFGGVGLAFFTEYLDNTIKTPEDIEKRMFMPSLGIVPLYNAGTAAEIPLHKKKRRRRKAVAYPEGRPLPLEYISYLDSKHQLSEAYSSIRTFLLFSSADKPPKVMMVTSSRRQEGKTTTSINTAISLTKSNAKAVLIDADMRRPRIHKVFKLGNEDGLSSFLSGNRAFGDDLIKHTDIPNLDVITSGPLPPNPAELLSSYRLRELIDGLSPLYNFIIFDTPPLLGLADAAIASTLADGVILVVRSGSTPRDAAVQARKVLESVNAKVLGVVLNAINENNLKYGHSYYHYYYQNYTSDER